MIPVRTVAPADLLTLSEIKAHCRVDHADDDAVLISLGQAAVQSLDGYAGTLGRCLANQTWAQQFAAWGELRLWCGAVQSAVVTYRDTADAEITVSASLYEVINDAMGAYVRFKAAFTSPDLNADRLAPITVTFVAGYGSPSAVPAPIKTAALMMVGHIYENRGNDPLGESPAIAALLSPYRRVWI